MSIGKENGWAIICIVILAGTCFNSYAAEEEVIITATRASSKISEIPFSVSRVDKTEIEKGQYLNLDESLNQIPGLYFSNRYNYSRDLRMSIRGLVPDQTLVLEG